MGDVTPHMVAVLNVLKKGEGYTVEEITEEVYGNTTSTEPTRRALKDLERAGLATRRGHIETGRKGRKPQLWWKQ